MVAVFLEWQSAAMVLGQAAEPALRRLDPATRAKVLATLAGLIILGIALMIFAWLGSRATRRYMASDKPRSRTDPDDWAKKPLDSN